MIHSYIRATPPMTQGGTVTRFPYFEPSRKDNYDIAFMDIYLVICVICVLQFDWYYQ